MGLNDQFLAEGTVPAPVVDKFVVNTENEPADPAKVTINVFENAEPGEVPELREDVDLIAAAESLEIQLRDLSLLRESIALQGGMSLSIAQESMTCLPGFVGDDRPLGYFTAHPSKTQLKAALEAIDGEEKKAGNAIVELIKKVYEWISARLKQLKDWLASFKEKTPAVEKEDVQAAAKASAGPEAARSDVDAQVKADISPAAKEAQVDAAILQDMLTQGMKQVKAPEDSIAELKKVQAKVAPAIVFADPDNAQALVGVGKKLKEFIDAVEANPVAAVEGQYDELLATLPATFADLEQQTAGVVNGDSVSFPRTEQQIEAVSQTIKSAEDTAEQIFKYFQDNIKELTQANGQAAMESKYDEAELWRKVITIYRFIPKYYETFVRATVSISRGTSLHARVYRGWQSEYRRALQVQVAEAIASNEAIEDKKAYVAAARAAIEKIDPKA